MRTALKPSTNKWIQGALALSLVSCSFVSVAESIGTILVAVNKVVAVNNSKERTLSRGSAVNLGDNVMTKEGSKAQIKYNNGTLVSLEANTNYQTLKLGSGKDQSFTSKVDNGTFTYQSTGGKKGTIKTPVVALAILGTKLQATVTKTSTDAVVTEGLVELIPSAGGPTLLIGPGQPNNAATVNGSAGITPNGQQSQSSGSTQSSASGTTGGGSGSTTTSGDNTSASAGTDVSAGSISQVVSQAIPATTDVAVASSANSASGATTVLENMF